MELFEVTATPIPAYADTEISARSQLSIRDIKPVEHKENQDEKENKHERSAMLMSAFFNAFIRK